MGVLGPCPWFEVASHYRDHPPSYTVVVTYLPRHFESVLRNPLLTSTSVTLSWREGLDNWLAASHL